MAEQRFHDRQPLFLRLQLLFALLLFKFGGFRHAVADPERRQHQHDAKQERQTPAPAEELFIGGAGAYQRHQPCREQQSDAVAHLHAAAVERLLIFRRALYRQQRRASPFAAHRKALDGA